MKKIIICLTLFIIIMGVSAEFLINRTRSDVAAISFAIIMLAAFYYLVFKPLKKYL